MRPVLLTVTTALTLIAAQSAATAQIPGLTGTLIVTNKSPSTATIIDVGGGRTLATLRTGTGPHEIASNTSRGARQTRRLYCPRCPDFTDVA